MMLVSNDDVPNGHANGTRVIVKSVVVKAGVTVGVTKVDGLQCKVADASDIDHIVCIAEGNHEKVFKIGCKKLTCMIRAPVPSVMGAPSSASINLTVQMHQFPIIPNYATTGHKLQGQSKDNLVVSVWSKKRNWNYVALSRVRTREGLYIVKPLPYDADFSIPSELSQMMVSLRTKIPANELPFTVEDERRNRRGVN
jgi:hypothetical protein